MRGNFLPSERRLLFFAEFPTEAGSNEGQTKEKIQQETQKKRKESSDTIDPVEAIPLDLNVLARRQAAEKRLKALSLSDLAISDESIRKALALAADQGVTTATQTINNASAATRTTLEGHMTTGTVASIQDAIRTARGVDRMAGINDRTVLEAIMTSLNLPNDRRAQLRTVAAGLPEGVTTATQTINNASAATRTTLEGHMTTGTVASIQDAIRTAPRVDRMAGINDRTVLEGIMTSLNLPNDRRVQLRAVAAGLPNGGNNDTPP